MKRRIIFFVVFLIFLQGVLGETVDYRNGVANETLELPKDVSIVIQLQDGINVVLKAHNSVNISVDYSPVEFNYNLSCPEIDLSELQINVSAPQVVFPSSVTCDGLSDSVRLDLISGVVNSVSSNLNLNGLKKELSDNIIDSESKILVGIGDISADTQQLLNYTAPQKDEPFDFSDVLALLIGGGIGFLIVLVFKYFIRKKRGGGKETSEYLEA